MVTLLGGLISTENWFGNTTWLIVKTVEKSFFVQLKACEFALLLTQPNCLPNWVLTTKI